MNQDILGNEKVGIMKLFECKNHTWVKLLVTKEGVEVPPAARPLDEDACIYFDHIDGMYSFCLDVNGELVHPAAWTEIEVVKDHEVLRGLVTWGGRGKNNDEPLTVRKVKDMSDDHIQAVIVYAHKYPIRPDIYSCLLDEKDYRIKHNIRMLENDLNDKK